ALVGAAVQALGVAVGRPVGAVE
ncbi:MAG: hypothetical protein RLZZ203_1795, partial [Cyanobacteriota bacterium]